MNTHSTHPTLDDVLDDFALADPQPNQVSEWMTRYPNFAEDIRTFSAEWFAIKNPSEDTSKSFKQEALGSDRNRFVKAGVTLMKQQLSDVRPKPAPSSLSELLTRRSLKAPQLRSMLGLSRRFWTSITEHTVVRDTPEATMIWDRIISVFAFVLDAPRGWVISVLDSSTSSSLSFSSSDSRPIASEPVSLMELVQNDTGLNDQTRQYLLTGEGFIPGMDQTDE